MRNSFIKRNEMKKKVVRLVCLILAIIMASTTIAMTLIYLIYR